MYSQISVNNNKPNWARLEGKIEELNLERNVTIWYSHSRVFEFLFDIEPEVWHLQQDDEVIVDYDDKRREYTLLRVGFLVIGGIFFLYTAIQFVLGQLAP